MILENTPLFAESWNVAFRQIRPGGVLHDTDTPFQVIPNSFRYWAANPFVIERNEKTYIFAELYDYVLRRGVLGFCEIRDGKPGKWTPVIREPYHLSYPCLMERDGRVFLMPESGEGGVLTIYEAVDFPYNWEKRQVLRENVRFADTTPFPKDGMHLALTHRVNDPEAPQLTLIDLDGTLPDRPVVGAAPFRSRPAGHPWRQDGTVIRPVQYSKDCGTGYGKALIFCACALSEHLLYQEAEISMLHPEDLRYDRPIFLDGMHTYNSSEHYEVIDIKTRRFNLLNFVMRIAGKFLRR